MLPVPPSDRRAVRGLAARPQEGAIAVEPGEPPGEGVDVAGRRDDGVIAEVSEDETVTWYLAKHDSEARDEVSEHLVPEGETIVERPSLLDGDTGIVW